MRKKNNNNLPKGKPNSSFYLIIQRKKSIKQPKNTLFKHSNKKKI